MLCAPGDDLRDIKIHEFRKYMQNELVLEHCATNILSGMSREQA